MVSFAGAAHREDVDQVEHEEAVHGAEHQDQEQDRPERGQGDVAEALPVARAVHLGGRM